MEKESKKFLYKILRALKLMNSIDLVSVSVNENSSRKINGVVYLQYYGVGS